MGKWARTAAAVSLFSGVLAAGQAAGAAGQGQAAKPELFIDGRLQQNAYVTNGRTMVQLIAFDDPQWVGYEYEKATGTIVIHNPGGDMTVRLQPGATDANVNGIRADLDAPVAIKDGRTYVPLRFLSETLGGTVIFDADAKRSIVRTPSGEKAYRTLMEGRLNDARNIAINLPRVPLGNGILPLSDGSSTTYTFPMGEALRFTAENKGLISYIEIDGDGLAEVKWQKDTWSTNGQYREVGQEPPSFGESVYFNYDPKVPEYSLYGTIQSDGKDNQLGHYIVDENRQKTGNVIDPIDDEHRTDERVLSGQSNGY